MSISPLRNTVISNIMLLKLGWVCACPACRLTLRIKILYFISPMLFFWTVLKLYLHVKSEFSSTLLVTMNQMQMQRMGSEAILDI